MSEVSGKVKLINPEIQVSASFVKRELVVSTTEQYPQHILINFVQDKVDLLDKLKVGDEVTVSYNLRGREWINPQGEAKYFNDIQGWRVQKIADAPVNEAPVHEAQAYEPDGVDNDLPF